MFHIVQLNMLRELMQGENKAPKAPLADNFRPLNLLNSRVVRTNINFRANKVRKFEKNFV